MRERSMTRVRAVKYLGQSPFESGAIAAVVDDGVVYCGNVDSALEGYAPSQA